MKQNFSNVTNSRPPFIAITHFKAFAHSLWVAHTHTWPKHALTHQHFDPSKCANFCFHHCRSPSKWSPLFVPFHLIIYFFFLGAFAVDTRLDCVCVCATDRKLFSLWILFVFVNDACTIISCGNYDNKRNGKWKIQKWRRRKRIDIKRKEKSLEK